MNSSPSSQDLRRMLIEAADTLNPAAGSIAEIHRQGRKRRRTRTAIAGGCATLAVLGFSTAAVRSATEENISNQQSGSVASSRSTRMSDTDFQQRALPALPLLKAAGASDPDFASVILDVPGRAVFVYRKSGRPDFRYTRIADRYQVRLKFGSAMMTATEYQTTMDSLAAAHADLSRAGIQLYSIDENGHGPIEVGVDRVTPQAVAIARRHAPYGPGTVIVVKRTPIVPR
jgi:hypothetical protein